MTDPQTDTIHEDLAEVMDHDEADKMDDAPEPGPAPGPEDDTDDEDEDEDEDGDDAQP